MQHELMIERLKALKLHGMAQRSPTSCSKTLRHTRAALPS